MPFSFFRRGSFVAACVGFAIGCGAPGPGESVGENAAPLTFANDQAAFNYFLAKGLTNFQAAGIVGNLDQESGVDPTAVQSGGPGRGIAQWSVGGRWDTDANDNATWYAGTQGQNVETLPLQLDFIWYELTTFSNYGLAALQQSTNVTDATIAFETDFEGCGTCDEAMRISYAQNVLSNYGSDTVDSGGAAPDAGATTCFVTTLGVSGVCILTSACAALPGHVSTPNYCPGAADIECCTGPSEVDASMPSEDSGMLPPADSGSTHPADSGSADSGSPGPGSADSGSADSGGTNTQADSGVPTTFGMDAAPGTVGSDGGKGPPIPFGEGPTSASQGCSCSTAPGAPSDVPAGLWLTGLTWVAIRRRRRSRPASV